MPCMAGTNSVSTPSPAREFGETETRDSHPLNQAIGPATVKPTNGRPINWSAPGAYMPKQGLP